MVRISLFLFFLILGVFGFIACNQAKTQQELELRRSFRNFALSVDQVHEKGLYQYVYFPEVKNYKKHVQDILLAYLDDLSEGKPLTFDDQGVVLVRFLGMTHHNYLIKEVKPLEDVRDVAMKISMNFSYDATIRLANYEHGARVFIPGEPWGTFHTLTIGEANEIPRQQLSYLEMDVIFRRTNNEGYWQVRSCKVDEESLTYERSVTSEFH